MVRTQGETKTYGTPCGLINLLDIFRNCSEKINSIRSSQEMRQLSLSITLIAAAGSTKPAKLFRASPNSLRLIHSISISISVVIAHLLSEFILNIQSNRPYKRRQSHSFTFIRIPLSSPLSSPPFLSNKTKNSGPSTHPIATSEPLFFYLYNFLIWMSGWVISSSLFCPFLDSVSSSEYCPLWICARS